MGEMIFYTVFVAIILLIGLYNLLIAILGLFSNCRATALGVLKYARTQRNVPVKGGKIPIVTDYMYQYTVNGKKYSYSSSGRFTKGNLRRNVTMVYVKWFPRHAYPQKFTAIKQWALGISMLLIGLMFIAVIVFA